MYPDGAYGNCHVKFEEPLINLPVLAQLLQPEPMTLFHDGCTWFAPFHWLPEKKWHNAKVEPVAPWFLKAERCYPYATTNTVRWFTRLDDLHIEVDFVITSSPLPVEISCRRKDFMGGYEIVDSKWESYQPGKHHTTKALPALRGFKFISWWHSQDQPGSYTLYWPEGATFQDIFGGIVDNG
jgi:hypothetical protein